MSAYVHAAMGDACVGNACTVAINGVWKVRIPALALFKLSELQLGRLNCVAADRQDRQTDSSPTSLVRTRPALATRFQGDRNTRRTQLAVP